MIVFRADASPALGGGHLARCLALADAVRAHGGTIHVVTRAGDGAALLARRSIPHTTLAPGEPDAEGTLRALAALPQRPAWLVVDHYGLAAPWETAIRSAVDRVLAIDDLADRPHACDVLLDQNPYRDRELRYAGLVPAGCRQLLGLEYALLRDEFAAARATLAPRPAELRSMVVSLGGSDPDNRTLDVLRGYQQLGGSPPELHVVIGAHNRHRDAVLAACATDPRITIHIDVTEMAELLSRMDLAIGAVGGSTWERCCLGLPQLVIALNATHHPLARDLADQGLVRYLGDGAQLAPAAYATAIAAALSDPGELRAMAARAHAVVDGQGTQRVRSALHLDG